MSSLPLTISDIIQFLNQIHAKVVPLIPLRTLFYITFLPFSSSWSPTLLLPEVYSPHQRQLNTSILPYVFLLQEAGLLFFILFSSLPTIMHSCLICYIAIPKNNQMSQFLSISCSTVLNHVLLYKFYQSKNTIDLGNQIFNK